LVSTLTVAAINSDGPSRLIIERIHALRGGLMQSNRTPRRRFHIWNP
jgi:hypothetical protein